MAAWTRYVGGVDEHGRVIDVRDPMAERLRAVSDSADTPEGKVAALLGVRDVFPPDLVAALQTPVTGAATRLWKDGTRAAITQVLA